MAELLVRRSGFRCRLSRSLRGTDRRSVVDQLRGIVGNPPLVARIEVRSGASRTTMLNELRVLGISRETMFPDLEGLARELGEIY
jgi:hypothetical protein